MITPGADDLRSSKIDTLTVSGFLNDDAVYTNVEVTPEKRCAPQLSERADRCLARTEIELPPAPVDRVVIRVGAVSPVADASGPLPISITELGVKRSHWIRQDGPAPQPRGLHQRAHGG
jgi:hypothetical protein